jgi:hypothetical protein
LIFTLLQLGEDASFRFRAKSGSCSISLGRAEANAAVDA